MQLFQMTECNEKFAHFIVRFMSYIPFAHLHFMSCIKPYEPAAGHPFLTSVLSLIIVIGRWIPSFPPTDGVVFAAAADAADAPTHHSPDAAGGRSQGAISSTGDNNTFAAAD